MSEWLIQGPGGNGRAAAFGQRPEIASLAVLFR